MFHVKCVPCHHSMAHPQIADWGEDLQIWEVVANTVKPHIYAPLELECMLSCNLNIFLSTVSLSAILLILVPAKYT